MSDIHNVGKRMPLIIPQDRQDDWLFAQGRDEIDAFIKPFAGELSAHRTLEVTKIRGTDTNIADIQKPI